MHFLLTLKQIGERTTIVVNEGDGEELSTHIKDGNYGKLISGKCAYVYIYSGRTDQMKCACES